MIDPFTAWYRLALAAAEMSATAVKASNTVAATPEIISRRTGMIGAAISSPSTGNYAELSRMVPEKVQAFSAAWTVVATEMLNMQAAWWREVAGVSATMSIGRLPTMIEAESAVDRFARYNVRTVERVAEMGTAALAPVALQVRKNSRRLHR